MARWTVVVMAALLGSSLVSPAMAQWKWRDRNNQVQYSDLPPPPGTPDSDILQRPSGATARRTGLPAVSASGASAPTLAPRASEPELEAKRKKAEQDAADQKKAEDAKLAAAKAENCNRAKAQMRTINSGLRLTRANDKGEIEYLDDAARAQEANRTQSTIATQCQ